MIQFLNGVDAASALAERELAEDDAKHLAAPGFPKFLSEPPKRLALNGEVIPEGKAKSAQQLSHDYGPRAKHNFKNPGDALK